MTNTKDMTTQELTILREALTDYKVNLRTIWPTPTESKVVNEKTFLAMDWAAT